MAENREEAGRMRVWPGVAAPVGLTLLLMVAAWLFNAKATADRDDAEAETLRRESYARLEAGEIAASAKKIVASLVETVEAERRNQAKNLQLEARGVLDSVYRLMTASLDGSRKNSLSRRDVGLFPPGFDGVRSFLEILPPGGDDEALGALRAATPELSALLPPGCSLTVVEDNSRQLFSIGGGPMADDGIAAAMTRDFVFNDGGRSRLWSLRVEATAPDGHPEPVAADVAANLSVRFGELHLDGVSWRGWLLGNGGKAAAAFGPNPRSSLETGTPEPPPFIDIQGEWMDLDGKRLVWLEKAGREAGAEWEAAVAVAMAKPAPAPDLYDAFFAETRWSATLGVLAFLTLTGWCLFVRAALSSRRARTAGAPAVEPAQKRETQASRKEAPLHQGRRLVRDDSRTGRAIPEVEGKIIVADIGEDGRVRLDESLLHLLPLVDQALNRPRPKPKVMPTGSLTRLQAIHRGREGLPGSRVLDQAKSQVLKELANRVRPAAVVQQSSRPAGKTIPSMKSATGWKKVE